VCRDPVSHPPESEYQVCTHSRVMQPRKKRDKHKKEPVGRSSTGASGSLGGRSGGSRWRPSQICRTWLPPQDLSSPSPPLYMDMGMVMMPKKGVPREVQWAGACLFSYILKGEPDGYSDGLCRACTPYAPAAESRSPRAPCPRQACAGWSPRSGAQAMNTARVFATSALSTLL
jgi:hypothetical protein